MSRTKLTLAGVRNELKLIGWTIRRQPAGDFRVNERGGDEASAYYTEDLQDALDTACAEARARAAAPVTMFDAGTSSPLPSARNAQRGPVAVYECATGNKLFKVLVEMDGFTAKQQEDLQDVIADFSAAVMDRATAHGWRRIRFDNHVRMMAGLDVAERK